MIQRIQSIYLLIVFCLLLSLFFIPYGAFIVDIEEFSMFPFNIKGGVDSTQPISTLYLGILAACCTALPPMIIFLYKQRWVQIRLCIVEMVLLLGLQGFLAYYLWRIHSAISTLENWSMSYAVVDVIPVVSLILCFLAFRGIARDEALVRSLERIR